MIPAILFFLVLLAPPLFLAAVREKRFEDSAALTTGAMILLMFACGMIGLLKFSVYLILGGTAVLLFLSVFLTLRRKQLRRTLDAFFTPGFLAFALVYVFLLYAHYNRVLHVYDEFTHWGDVVKAMSQTDVFSTSPQAHSYFSNYVPGMALFQYLFEKIAMVIPGGIFTDWRMYFAYHLLVFIFLLPFIAGGWSYFRSLRIDWRVWLLVLLFMLSSSIGLLVHTTTIYSVGLSCIVFLPLLFLLFSTPSVWKSRPMYYAARAFITILLIIDVLGLYFWLLYGGDEFGMAYGRHYEYVHGLAMINTYVLLWYVMKFFYGKMTMTDWCIASFIALSWVCCQFGLGFVCLILTFVILLLTARKFKVLLFSALLLAGAWFLLQTSHFTYERVNIMKLTQRSDVRKMVMFDRFASLLCNDPQVLFIGTGAGGLFVSQRKYTDGTRNMPFSSAVSIWAENGLLFFLLFCYLCASQIRRLRQYRADRVSYNYLLALDIFMIISLVSHMWFETSEFLVYILIRHTVLSNIQYKLIIMSRKNNIMSRRNSRNSRNAALQQGSV